MDKNIELYHKEYNKQLTISHKYIKKELILHCKDFHDEYFACNTTIKRLSDIKKSLINQLQKFEELIKDFDNRTSKFKDEFQFMIIPKVLKSKFKELNDSEMSFEQFISKLATLNAYKEVSRTFHVNNSIYRRISELNRFDLFDVKEYKPLLEKSELYEKLWDGSHEKKSLEDCISEEDLLELKDYIELDNSAMLNDNNIEDTTNLRNINFKIREEFRDFFKEEYDFFTDHFIDEDQVDFECFINVFLKDTNTHNSSIKFFCDNPTATYLLFKLGKSLFSKLTQINIAESKRFISNEGTSFSQSTFSRSKDKVSLKNEELIDSFIEKLKIRKYKS